jgi:hypothetical protein
VTRFIITAQEFRTSWRLKMKRPFELAAAAMRALQADFVRLPGGVRWTFEQMGQPLFGHRSPNGYADRMDAWANTMVSLYSWNLVNGLVNNWWRDEQEGGSLKTDVAANTPSALTSAGDMVDAWLARLELVDFSEESRQAVIDFLNRDSAQQRERLPGAVGLLLMSPDFRCR